MVSIEEAGEMLDELAAELPREFFNYLNGGVIVFPEAKPHPKRIADDLYILGEYHHEYDLGRYIIIYYGSFERAYGHLEPEAFKTELRKVLRHEFTHHLESLAGERDLEVQDAIELEQYRMRHEDS